MTHAPIDEIFALFDAAGSECYGEDITQLEHALQVAELTRLAGAAPALIVAALLHDVGQLIDDAGNAAERDGTDMRREVIGASLLSTHFPPSVCEPVRLHVDAKRYLAAAEPGYREALSRASIVSMALQGGEMDGAECAAFESHPYFAEAVLLRRCDDDGKRTDWAVPPLASYRPLIEAQLLPA